MQDIFHWEGCQVFPLYTSLTLLSPLLYITFSVAPLQPVCLCISTLSHFALLCLPLCFCLSAGSSDVWHTVNSRCSVIKSQ